MSYKPVSKPLEWFKGNPENYRSHPPEQQAVLQESLRRFGIFRNVVARPDGTLLAGHGILAAAQAEGLKQFPVIVFEGTDEEARALMVADNEQARLAEDDPDMLSQLLTSIAADGLMDVTGHDDDSLAALLQQVADANPPTGVAPGDGDRMTLAERFGVPPFSILDARQGYWQDRKRKWLATGIQSELGRGGGHLEGVRDRQPS